MSQLVRIVTAFAVALGAARTGGAQTAADSGQGARREAAEQRFQQRVARIVQERLRLSDSQMRRLAEVNRRYAPRRQELLGRERNARRAVRREVVRGEGADQRRVAALVDELFALQRQRLDLLQEEQRDLGQFLTPTQRAQYLELQEQVRRRVERVSDGRRHPGPRGGRRP